MATLMNQNKFLSICFILLASTACDKISFQAVPVSCEAPPTSARFGKTAGPVILEPTAGSFTSGIIRVQGTCVNGLPVSIQEASGSITTADCTDSVFSAKIELPGTDGQKDLIVSQNTSSEGKPVVDRLCFTKDTTPPKVGFTNSQSTQSMNQPVTSVSGYCEGNLPVLISGPGLTAPVQTDCVDGHFSTPVQTIPGDGTKDLVATQVDPVGNQGKADTQFNIDTTPPVVKITAPAADSVTRDKIALLGTCETGLQVGVGEPRSPTAAYTDCNNGSFSIQVALPNEGANSVKVFQVDLAGNLGSDARNFIKDSVAPAVSITSPLANAYISPSTQFSGTCENGWPVQLSGSALTSPQTATCSNGQWTLSGNITTNQGAQILVAEQTDLAGNLGKAQQTYQIDTVAPLVAFTSPAANSYVSATANLQGTCESGLTVQISGSGLSASSTANCANGIFTASVNISAGDGSKIVNLSQTDMAGNTGTASRTFLRDSTGPTLSITSPAQGSYVTNSFTLTGTCEAGLTVQISGAGIATPASTTCSNAGTYSLNLNTSAGDGTKVVTASETDAAQNTTQVSSSYLKDMTAPLVAITSPSANTQARTGLTVGGTCESGLTVSLTGPGLNAPVSTNCVNGSFSADILFSSGDGVKTITASQTDAAGNTGSGSQNFVRNTQAPLLTITSPAANSYLPTNFTLQGQCETGLNVVISGSGLAAGATVACVNGNYSASLQPSAGDGTKTVTASETDSIGNTNQVSENYLRDTVPPVLTITSPMTGSSVGATLTLQGACEAGLQVQIAGPGVSAATSVTCAANGTYSAALTLSAGDGNKTLNLSETDAAGNLAQAMGMYVKDTTAPVVAITAPAAGTQARTGLTVSGTCESGWNVNLSGSGMSAPVTTTCSASGTFSADIVFSAGDGAKPVTASQTDSVGNTGSDSRTFAKDNTPPAITINSPAANSYVGSTFVLTGNCETGLSVTISGSGIASTGTVPCSNGSYSTTLSPTSGDGVKTVLASQTDMAGNQGQATRNFKVDSQAPILTISSPANGSYVSNTFTITGTCEAGLTVNFSGAGVSGTSSTLCSTGGTYSTTLTTSAGDGNKIVQLSETDAAGNTSTATGSYNKDFTAPAIAITSPAAGTEAQNGLTVSGTCEAGLAVTLAGPGLSAPVSTTCPSGSFSANVVFSAGDGSKTVTASQTDAAGNVGTDSRNFVKDTTAPILTINSPAANVYLAATFTLTGDCQTGSPVQISGAGISAPTTAVCASGSYSANLTTSASDGTKTVTVTQSDAAGNTATVSRNFLRDATAPAITITSPAAGASVPVSTNIQGTCETGASVVQITGDLAGTVTGPCNSGNYNIAVTFSAGRGMKNVLVRQTDAAGNVGQASSQFSRDSDAAVETFVSDASFGKIDILFVDDNSASMDPQQASLGTKFSGFANELKDIDWQIGITTTDCSSGPYGICGSLLQMTGLSQKILTPSVNNYASVFNKTIQRPETAGCLDAGTCPSGNSQPLLSATTAMTKKNSDNAGFFRTDSDLAIVILSDADEGQNSPPSMASRPQDLVNTFNQNWPSGKKLSVYSIIVKPGDSACLNQLNSTNGGFSFYGNYIDQTVNLTSGLSTSICSPDYVTTLKNIGESVRTLTNSVQLAHTPIASSVNVTFNPSQNIQWKVIGDKVVFDSPPSVGTQIQVSYQY